MIVKYPYMLKECWNDWIDEEDKIRMKILDKGSSTVNEPIIWKDNDGYGFITISQKGRYYFQCDRSTLIFEGYRNSFGSTSYFYISNDLSGETTDLFLYTGSNVAIPLYVMEFKTSAPEQKFWAIENRGVMIV